MTDKLHCPFCGAELKTDVNLLGYSTKYWYCENTSCAHLKDSMHEDVWQALIDGKAAQEALNDAVDEIDRALYANHYNDKAGVRKLLKDLRASITKRSEE